MKKEFFVISNMQVQTNLAHLKFLIFINMIKFNLNALYEALNYKLRKTEYGCQNKSLTPIFKALKKCCRNGWIDRETYDEITECYLPSNGKVLGEDKQIEYLTIEQLDRKSVV